MAGVRRRPLPAVPGLSAFPELNLRLYVERDGKPGVWFLSLDAASALAVWAAKRFFHLPYYLAEMDFKHPSDRFTFSSRRLGGTPVSFRADYRPTSPVFEAKPNTLESFLVERYCLYAQAANGALYRGDVHHVPWPLQQAEGEIEAAELVTPHGLSLNGPPLLHFSRGVDVVVWPFTRLTQ